MHHVYIYILGACGGQKVALDPLQLELQMAMNHLVGSKNQTQIHLQESPVLLTTEPYL